MTDHNSQDDLLNFVTAPETIKQAAEGSMEKRQAVFDKHANSAAQEEPFMFGKQEITCGYCKRTLPSKFCKRHSLEATMRRYRTYTAEQMEAEATRRELELLDSLKIRPLGSLYPLTNEERELNSRIEAKRQSLTTKWAE